MNIQQVGIFRALLGFSVTCLLAFNAQAALFDDYEARRDISDLRKKFVASQIDLRKISDDNLQLRRSLLDLSNQIEALRSDLAKLLGEDEQLARDVAKLRGQDEQFARDVAEMQRRQKDLSQGVDDRLRKFEPAKVMVDGVEFVAQPAEIRKFDAALATMRKGDFATAQTAFLDFYKHYPDSGYKASMLFWLGNAQYALRSYHEAIINFKALITLAPEHSRAPEASLSIANCQLELKDTRSAFNTLEDLIKVYPKSEAAAVAKDRLTKLK